MLDCAPLDGTGVELVKLLTGHLHLHHSDPGSNLAIPQYPTAEDVADPLCDQLL